MSNFPRRNYRIQPLDKKLEWVGVLAYHMLVVAGVALAAAGSAKLAKHEPPLDKDEKIAKAGIAILAVAWGVLVGWTGFSFTAPKGRNVSLTRAGTVVSLPHFAFIRNAMLMLPEAACDRLFLTCLHRHPSLLQSCCAVHAAGVA